MRHPFTTQLRRARTAAAIEARNRPAQGAGPGRQVPRLLVWSGVTLLVALAALGVLLPAGTALGGVADERGQRAAQEQVTIKNATRQELAERWNYYNHATRMSLAELKARMQADATQRELSERWTYYYHATRMSPAELKVWMQAKEQADTSTAPPAQVPPRRDRASRTGSQPGSSSRLGVWPQCWRSSLDWRCWPLGVRTVGLGSGQRLDCGHGRQLHRLDDIRPLGVSARRQRG
jgi:hypothetical protein